MIVDSSLSFLHVYNYCKLILGANCSQKAVVLKMCDIHLPHCVVLNPLMTVNNLIMKLHLA